QGRARSEQSYNLEQARLNQKVKEEEMQVQYIERQRQVELEQEEQKRRKTQADSNAYDIRAKAEAEAERDRIDGQTKAEIEKQKGLAEAEVIRERGRAEAEAKELMAKAMENYGDAAIIEMLVDMLPKYAHEIAQPLSQISEMKVIDMGGSNGSGSTKITDNVTKTMTGLQASLKESTGMDLKAMLESFVSRGNYNAFATEEKAQNEEERESNSVTEETPYESEVASAYEEEVNEEKPDELPENDDKEQEK
ncbi:MAG: flotillin domain-containing protein, partial [Anaerobacillus sp.]